MNTNTQQEERLSHGRNSGGAFPGEARQYQKPDWLIRLQVSRYLVDCRWARCGRASVTLASAVRRLSVLSACFFFFTTGCEVREAGSDPPGVSADVTVEGPPPPLIVEQQPVSPGVDFVWIPGVWAWHGRWEWERGRWDRPPHPGARWVQHRYEYRNGRHVYVRGGWR